MAVFVARLVARIAGACRRSSSVEIACDVGNESGRICAVELDRLGAFDNNEWKF